MYKTTVVEGYYVTCRSCGQMIAGPFTQREDAQLSADIHDIERIEFRGHKAELKSRRFRIVE